MKPRLVAKDSERVSREAFCGSERRLTIGGRQMAISLTLHGRCSSTAFGEKKSVVISELSNEQRIRINFVDDTVFLINAS